MEEKEKKPVNFKVTVNDASKVKVVGQKPEPEKTEKKGGKS